MSGPNPSFLAFGQVARVGMPDGYRLVMHLPPPDPANIGKRCGRLRRVANVWGG
jgi:hypothetical protein